MRAGNRRWAPAIVVAVGGIALSFMVMLVSVAVVTGFKDEIRRKIMGFDAQITVSPLKPAQAVTLATAAPPQTTTW